MGVLSGADRAVSPVVGGILLVAIGIVLSVVTAGMVLDLGEEREPAPEVALSLDPADAAAGEYVLVHESGETLDGEKVELRGVEDPDVLNGETLTASDRQRVVPTAETVTVVYHGDHGTTYTLRQFDVDPSTGGGSGGDSGLSLPAADEGCSWVDTESDNGTDPVKVDGLVVDCDVTTDDGIEVLGGGAVIGETISNAKDLDLDDATVYGDVTVETVANVQDGAVYGTIVSDTADVKIDNSAVNESIQGQKIVEVSNGATVEGDAVSDTKAVKVLSGSTVEGDAVSDAGKVKVDSATVEGDVDGDTVELNDATVEGDVDVDGDFDCTDSTIDGKDCSSYST